MQIYNNIIDIEIYNTIILKILKLFLLLVYVIMDSSEAPLQDLSCCSSQIYAGSLL